jgi:hypothetical protein
VHRRRLRDIEHAYRTAFEADFTPAPERRSLVVDFEEVDGPTLVKSGTSARSRSGTPTSTSSWSPFRRQADIPVPPA